METKNEIKRIKFIFFLFILLSNAIIFMVSKSNDTSNESQNIYIREDFIFLKIKGEAKTIISKGVSYTLVSKNKMSIIKNVFILDEIKEKQSSIAGSFEIFSNYYIEVHKDYFKKMNLNDIYEIYPKSVQFNPQKKVKRKSYEINY